MLPQDKINKTSWTLHESVKDVIAQNLVTAIKSGQLKIEAASVERLLAVIASSADEGYHRGHKNFMNVVKAELNSTADNVSMPQLKAPKQKK